MKSRQVNIRIADAMRERINRCAAAECVFPAEWMRRALLEAIERSERKRKRAKPESEQ